MLKPETFMGHAEKLPMATRRSMIHMDHGEPVARAPDMRYQFFDKQTRHAIIMSR
jgi:hypothetical protein